VATRGGGEIEKAQVSETMSLYRPKGDGLSTDFIYREVFEDNCYLQHGVEISEGDLVIDVGANVGLASLYFADRVGATGAVISFEPTEVVFQCLEENVRARGLKHVYPQKLAIGSQSGEAEITIYQRGTSGWSTLYPDSSQIIADVAVFARNEGNVVFPGARFVPRVVKSALGKLSAFYLTRGAKTAPCKIETLSKGIRFAHSPLLDSGRQIALLKVDVERGEYQVLLGIEQEDWARIKQVVAEVHAGSLEAFVATLQGQSFGFIHTEQSKELDGSDLFNVFAIR
jgi:FkbM family methyltransferase